jgi:hypothetical protein
MVLRSLRRKRMSRVWGLVREGRAERKRERERERERKRKRGRDGRDEIPYRNTTG